VAQRHRFRHLGVDLLVVGRGIVCEQRRRRHDLPGLAVAALRHVDSDGDHAQRSRESTDGAAERFHIARDVIPLVAEDDQVGFGAPHRLRDPRQVAPRRVGPTCRSES
jgi:hypothetical protein